MVLSCAHSKFNSKSKDLQQYLIIRGEKSYNAIKQIFEVTSTFCLQKKQPWVKKDFKVISFYTKLNPLLADLKKLRWISNLPIS